MQPAHWFSGGVGTRFIGSQSRVPNLAERRMACYTRRHENDGVELDMRRGASEDERASVRQPIKDARKRVWDVDRRIRAVEPTLDAEARAEKETELRERMGFEIKDIGTRSRSPIIELSPVRQ